MTTVNLDLIHTLIKMAPKKLEGEWVLLGGTLLHYFIAEYRATSDIDLVPISSMKSNQNQLQVFSLAESLGLPVEFINSAALFFWRK